MVLWVAVKMPPIGVSGRESHTRREAVKTQLMGEFLVG
jgi:hypothetical protein